MPGWLAASTRAVLETARKPDSRQSILSVFDQAVVSATGFITSVILGRVCSKEELGIYYLALTLILFLRGLQEQITSTPYTVYCHRWRGETLAAYAGSCLLHQLSLTGFSLVVLLLASLLLSTAETAPGLASTAWVLIGAAPFLLMREYLRQMAFAHLRLGAVIGLDILVAAVQLAGLLLLVQFHVLSAPSVYAIMGAACALACLGWFAARVQPVRFRWGSCVADWRRNWSFAKWALAGQLAGSIAPYVLPWLLAHAHGAQATGVLAAAFTLVGVANILLIGGCNFLTPRAASAYATEGVSGLRRVLWAASLLFLASLGAFFVVAVTSGEFLGVLIYGHDYRGIGPIIAILALSMVANSLSMTASNGLFVLERTRANFVADLWMTAVALIAALALVYLLGVLGAALATLIGTTTGAAARYVILWRIMRSLPSSSLEVEQRAYQIDGPAGARAR